MARRRKLTDSQIRKIYTSSETAKALGDRFGVSQQMVYLIRSGRIHAAVTKGLKRGGGGARRSVKPTVDVNALADAMIDRLIKRLRNVKA